MNSPAVPSLFLAGGPSAIARLVIAIIVDAIKRPFAWFIRRSWPHVGDKVLEAMPAGADPYRAPTIQVVPVIARIIAPLDHPAPYPIDATVGKSVASIVFVSRRHNFLEQAATRLGVASEHIVRESLNFLAAIALEFAPALPSPGREHFYRG
jgi:hypothetical protein